MKANIVLISIDCLRADCLRSISGKNSITPNMDKLAKNGMLFTRAFSTSSWTPPAFKSILASLYPFSNGGCLNVRNNVTLPLIMKWLGYKSAAFHSNPWLTERFGYKRGFDDFYDFLSRDSSSRRLLPKTLIRMFKSLKNTLPYIDANQLTEHAISWISKNKERKFFVWIHFMDAHEPYMPVETPPSIFNIIKRRRIMVINKKAKEGSINAHDIDKLRKWYKQRVKAIDSCIGHIINVLNESNLSENTYVILLGDHGQQFFEHGTFGHGLQLYNELIHVPLIILGPNVEKQRIEKSVSLVDITPTILDILKYNVKKFHFHGRSLFTYIHQDREREVISEEGRNSRWGPERGVDAKLESRCRKISLILGNWKYIYNAEGKDELYNLRRDFNERNNLIDQEIEIAVRMLDKIKKFIAWLEKTNSKISILRQKINRMKLERKIP